jgi:creatinine amidohydrolase
MAAAHPNLIAELTAPEVSARLAAGAAVLLPMASTETHGPAAPMGDFLLTDEIARRIAEAASAAGTDALVAPALPYGGEDFFSDTPGCIALTTPVLQAVVEEVAENFLRHGMRRLLIVNGHGGSIPAIEGATRALRRRHGVLVPTLHLWRAAAALHGELGGTPERLGHGGDPVWSVLLHLRPELARPERLRARQAPPPVLGLPVSGFGLVRCGGAEFSLPLTVEEIAPGGVAAPDAKGGSAEFGAALVERLVAAGATMLGQLSQEG